MNTKKINILLVLTMLCSAVGLKAQNVTVNFEYDENGNRTRRYIELKKVEENGKSLDTEETEGWLAEVSETMQGAELSIYPNPTSGLLNVNIASTENSTSFHLTLSTLSGTIIEERSSAGGHTQLDISQLAQGMYLLTVSTPGERRVWKVVKH